MDSERRREIISKLPGVDLREHVHDKRTQDLDRMYERVLRARIAADDDETNAAIQANTGFGASAIATGLVITLFAGIIIYMMFDRRNLKRKIREQNQEL